jgi:hypothetical protein
MVLRLVLMEFCHLVQVTIEFCMTLDSDVARPRYLTKTDAIFAAIHK